MPKVALFSNYLNHYQLPFSKKMVELTKGNYNFISQKAISVKRISLGFRNLSDENDFVVKTYEGKDELDRAFKIADEYDYVIFGGNTKEDIYVKNRIKNNKMTFEYSERLNKRKPSISLWLRKYINMFYTRRIYRNKHLYLLCNGSCVAGDFNEFGMYKNKAYKWGYFPKFDECDIDSLIKDKNECVTIIWAGRLINWKHPDLLIDLADRLKKDGYNFKIEIVGNGEMEDELKASISNKHLEDCVTMCGSMPPEEVRKHMEKANIYCFTSNFQEGWGVVLNEAMNSGCACVASHAAGSTGYLLNHNENGLIYENGNFDDFYKQVVKYIENPELRVSHGKKAYESIKNTWNADVAAERFLVLAKALQEGKDTPYNEGPCSKAMPFKNEELYKELVK